MARPHGAPWKATVAVRPSVTTTPISAGFFMGYGPSTRKAGPPIAQPPSANPSRSDTRDEADLFGSSGSAWHQWNKHGRCSGLSADDYYALSREAYSRVTRPALLRKLTDPVKVPALVIEEAFLEANPGLDADEITITCKAGRIQEARICLTRDLELRACGSDVARDCLMRDALLDPIR